MVNEYHKKYEKYKNKYLQLKKSLNISGGVMKQPYLSIYQCLVTEKNFPYGTWSYNVKFTGDTFYIGDNYTHITIVHNIKGWHLTHNRKKVYSYYDEINISTLLEELEKLFFDWDWHDESTKKIIGAVKWLKDNCREW